MRPEVTEWYPMFADITLVMIGFLLGGKFTLKTLREFGRITVIVSIIVLLVTALVVTGGLMAQGVDSRLAIILGAISCATAPVATLDVISEMGIQNRFTQTLEGIVALDDAWGRGHFSLCGGGFKIGGLLSAGGNGHGKCSDQLCRVTKNAL